MREFAFELALCAHLEGTRGVVARQLGAAVHGSRVLDVVRVHPGPAFERRVELTAAAIPPAVLEADVGVGRSRDWTRAFDCHPDRARRAIDRAVDVGFLERDRRGGHTYVRQTARYPDWVDRIVAIENKPDLDRPGDLRTQLRTDVSLGLVDEVVLATRSHVTRAHENRIPGEVGIWRFDPDGPTLDVVREPTQLPVDRTGVEVLESRPGRTRVRTVESTEKASARRALAERAFGKGWRTFEYPACANCQPAADGRPHCEWKGRVVHPGEECGAQCDGHELSAPPEVDTDALRAARTAWDPDAAGTTRHQARLDRFG